LSVHQASVRGRTLSGVSPALQQATQYSLKPHTNGVPQGVGSGLDLGTQQSATQAVSNETDTSAVVLAQISAPSRPCLVEPVSPVIAKCLQRAMTAAATIRNFFKLNSGSQEATPPSTQSTPIGKSEQKVKVKTKSEFFKKVVVKTKNELVKKEEEEDGDFVDDKCDKKLLKCVENIDADAVDKICDEARNSVSVKLKNVDVNEGDLTDEYSCDEQSTGSSQDLRTVTKVESNENDQQPMSKPAAKQLSSNTVSQQLPSKVAAVKQQFSKVTVKLQASKPKHQPSKAAGPSSTSKRTGLSSCALPPAKKVKQCSIMASFKLKTEEPSKATGGTCPICSVKFDAAITNVEINKHIDNCVIE